MKDLRVVKVAREVQRIISDLIVHDRIHENILGNVLINIIDVIVSKDLRYANIYLSFGEASDEDVTKFLVILNKESYRFNNVLSKSLSTKYIPKVRFLKDDVLDNASMINSILQDISNEDIDSNEVDSRNQVEGINE